MDSVFIKYILIYFFMKRIRDINLETEYNFFYKYKLEQSWQKENNT
jgi:hypothetical protein